MELVGNDKAEEVIQNTSCGRPREDILIWTLNDNGSFTSSSAWNLIRAKGPHVRDMDWLWHNLLPKKVSVRVWKARFHNLLLDEKVQSLGIAFASRCNCCELGKTEILNYILCSSEISVKDSKILSAFEISIITSKAQTHCVVSWRKPQIGSVKLNADSSCRGNLGTCGGGGVIRGCCGDFLGAFSSFFGYGSNNKAELRALTEGVQMCKDLGYMNVEIECDSNVVVDWVLSRNCIVWYLWDFREELLEALSMINFIIAHQFKEGNMAADFLAR
ncbi:uncharacterized protein LOC131151460 [Malania oleifera]|uniref:uncharacterized protein LOC131151460 n=1 Tax=Malania oleifera TaxID=397392 RepID=UPI0025AEB808|nr:uncharacterized protein LOC131151460 [Malania oleifera]